MNGWKKNEKISPWAQIKSIEDMEVFTDLSQQLEVDLKNDLTE